jgi:hypothetical protein
MNDRRDNEFMIVVPMFIGVSIVVYLTYSICSHILAGVRALTNKLASSCKRRGGALHQCDQGDIYQIGSTHASEDNRSAHQVITMSGIYTIE